MRPLLILLLLAAFYVRISHLNGTPPGISYDAASNLADALRIHQGIPLSAYPGTRPEPLYRFLLAFWYAFTGTHLFTANLLQGFFGLTGIALVYRATLEILRRHALRHLAALVAAGALSASLSHISLSRIAERGVLLPVVILAGVIFLLRAARTRTKKRWFAAGFITATAVYTYTAGLAALPWLAGFVLHQVIFQKTRINERNPTPDPSPQAGRGTPPPSTGEVGGGFSSKKHNRVYPLREGVRLTIREALALGSGVLLALIPWLLLLLSQPALYYRIGQAGANVADLTLSERLLRGVPVMLEAYTRGNDAGMFYNLPNTPPINLVFLPLAAVGIFMALWRWRQAEGALLLGGIVVFAIPALLSNDAQSSIRLTGTTTLLCVLAGWGAAGIAEAVAKIKNITQRRRDAETQRKSERFNAEAQRDRDAEKGTENSEPGTRNFFITISLSLLTSTLIAAALINAHQMYQAFWTTPGRYTNAPNTPDAIPYNYNVALTEALDMMTGVTEPTYVPLKSVNSAIAYYMLQREAYPNVTTWARYELTELPAGQIFYPEYDYFHAVQSAQEPLMVLLLPEEKTLVILPPDANQRIITRPEETDATATVITSERYGWVVARTVPRPAMPLPEQPLPEFIPIFGSGLELMNAPEDVRLTPGGLIDRVLLWRVSAPQPADIASVLQVVDMQFNAIAGHEYIVLEYLYPSGRWQAGDIVPDAHTLAIPAEAADTLYRMGTGAYVVPFAKPMLPIQKPPVLNHPGTLWLWGAGRITPPPATATPDNMTALPGIHFANDVRLLGYTLESQESQRKIHLYWKAERLPEADMVIFVHALDSAGTLVGQSDGLPNNGQTPMWSWLPEMTIDTTHEFTASAAPDVLSVGLYNPVTLARIDLLVEGVAVPEGSVTFWQNE